MPEIQLSSGTVHYELGGSGPPIVLIHGLLVNGSIWQRVAPLLAASNRVIIPDLPLGSHRTAMNDGADLSPTGLAGLIAELIERLGLDDVTLVGNDTGGALCQLVIARHPDHIGWLVLTNCDTVENFPPPAFKGVVWGGARIPGAIAALDLLGRSRAIRRAGMKAAPLTVEAISDELVKGWLEPLHDRRVRRDLVHVLRGINPAILLAAQDGLRAFERPALLAWGMRDAFFPFADAERLANTLPNARIERIEHARAFVQLDAPERLAELIVSLAAQHPAPAPRELA